MYLQIVFILLLSEGNGPLKTGLMHVRIYRCVYAYIRECLFSGAVGPAGRAYSRHESG